MGALRSSGRTLSAVHASRTNRELRGALVKFATPLAST
jgi:hypothetical protein